MENEKSVKSGVITVFFTFTGLLILALIGSMLYAALYTGSKAVGERTLRLSAQSVAAGFMAPLYEDYHIFGKLAQGRGGNAEMSGSTQITGSMESSLSIELTEWLSRSLNQGNDAAGTGFLMSQDVISTEVSQLEYLLSGGGEQFLNQVLAYQKYRTTSDAVLGISDLITNMKGIPGACVVLKKKEAAQEEYAAAAIGTAELMSLIDGVKWEQNYFILKKKGIFAAEQFVKKMWSGQISAQSTGLNHPEVFEKLKGNYTRFDILTEETISDLNEGRELEDGITGLETRIEDVQKEIEAFTGRETESEERNELMKRKEALENELLAAREERLGLAERSDSRIEEMIHTAKQSYDASEEALTLIEKTESKLAGAEKSLEVYEAVLEAGRKLIGQELYSQLKEEAVQLREHSGMEYDLEACRIALETWREEALKIRMKLLELRKPELTYESKLVKLNELAELCGELSWSGPSFDYSRLKTGKTEAALPEVFENLVSYGIASLVLPQEPEISEKILNYEALPSAFRGLTEEENVQLKQDFLFGLPLSGLVQTAAEKILFTEYVQDHFNHYSVNTENGKKDTALDYEQEYLLCGYKKDKDNLNGAITRIVLVRTLILFINLLTDSKARSEVSGAAEAAVLFTGIPVLKYVLMTAFLFVWAAALSLIEVCAMLSGKRLSVWPDRKNRIIAFSELLLLSPSVIRQKAELLKEEKGFAAGYQEYLMLWLAAGSQEKLIYRSADLIEANIRLRYDGDFRLLNCVCGFQAQAEFRVPLRFPVFPAVRDMLSGDGLNYRAQVRTCY